MDLYKYGKEGRYGDMDDAEYPEPDWWNVKDHVLWDAYHSLKGTDPAESRKKFLELAKPICDRLGISMEDPNKE